MKAVSLNPVLPSASYDAAISLIDEMVATLSDALEEADVKLPAEVAAMIGEVKHEAAAEAEMTGAPCVNKDTSDTSTLHQKTAEDDDRLNAGAASDHNPQADSSGLANLQTLKELDTEDEDSAEEEL
ncbi:hypothetical protein V5799_009051 [Amblyomma americanum]|uniref:Uncharacterized protein n=1 Tax=Amblyomma americanum TaxID=6943 RepID=A0AAQ4DAW2_AMBAM